MRKRICVPLFCAAALCLSGIAGALEGDEGSQQAEKKKSLGQAGGDMGRSIGSAGRDFGRTAGDGFAEFGRGTGHFFKEFGKSQGRFWKTFGRKVAEPFSK